jgi:hypothetical protein
MIVRMNRGAVTAASAGGVGLPTTRRPQEFVSAPTGDQQGSTTPPNVGAGEWRRMRTSRVPHPVAAPGGRGDIHHALGIYHALGSNRTGQRQAGVSCASGEYAT